MIRAVLFDLDGVLVEAKKIHFDSLNTALEAESDTYSISWNEHLTVFDGLKTNEKLELLHEKKNLPRCLFQKIWEHKQHLTQKALQQLPVSQNIKECVERLALDKIKIACCSNSIKKTVLTVLHKLDIIEYFDLILSNEDVKNSKPHPEIYWSAISYFKILPEEALIIEDSPYGLQAANRSHANFIRVNSPKELSYNLLKTRINFLNMKNINKTPKWVDKKLTVLIPMAGAGSRFEKAGYTFPKPLIDVNGKPMIQAVVDNLNMDAKFVFLVQKQHNKKYNLTSLLNLIVGGCSIVETEGLTEGAACTTLLARDYINNNDSLIIANSDQIVEWNSNEFMYKMNETECDGGIVTFNSTHPKWSFAKVNENGLVVEVAEKNPISNIATAGIYFWKRGTDYVKYAERMIEKNIRVNNEFYVCPVFNQAIADNKEIRIFEINKMWGIGTPEDLKYYIENYSINKLNEESANNS
jgi:HAD superfamily hydrolase (TIGR01509 family)